MESYIEGESRSLSLGWLSRLSISSLCLIGHAPPPPRHTRDLDRVAYVTHMASAYVLLLSRPFAELLTYSLFS